MHIEGTKKGKSQMRYNRK